MNEKNLPAFVESVQGHLSLVEKKMDEIDEIKEKIKELQDLKKAKEEEYEEIKKTLLSIFDAFGAKKYGLGDYKISIRNNPPSVEIENINDISEEYLIKKIKYEVDKKKIRAFYKEMQVVPAGVKIANGRSLTIKKMEEDDE